MALKFKNISDKELNLYKELFLTEEKREAAMLSSDTNTLLQILDADAIYIHSSATVDTTQSYITPISTGKVRYDLLNVEISRIISIDSDTVLLFGEVQIDAQLENGYAKLDNLYTMVWKYKNKAWKMYSWQSTKKL